MTDETPAGLEVPDRPHTRSALELEVIPYANLVRASDGVLLYVVQREVERISDRPRLINLVIQEGYNLGNGTIRESDPKLVSKKNGARNINLQRRSRHKTREDSGLNLVIVDREDITTIDISVQILERDDVSDLLLIGVIPVGEESRDSDTGEIPTRLGVEEERAEAEIEAELADSAVKHGVAIVDGHGFIGVIDYVLEAKLQSESQLIALVEPEPVGSRGVELQVVREACMVIQNGDADTESLHLIDLAMDIEGASEWRTLKASPLRPEETYRANDVSRTIIGRIKDTLRRYIIVEDDLILRIRSLHSERKKGSSRNYIPSYSSHIAHGSSFLGLSTKFNISVHLTFGLDRVGLIDERDSEHVVVSARRKLFSERHHIGRGRSAVPPVIVLTISETGRTIDKSTPTVKDHKLTLGIILILIRDDNLEVIIQAVTIRRERIRDKEDRCGIASLLIATEYGNCSNIGPALRHLVVLDIIPDLLLTIVRGLLHVEEVAGRGAHGYMRRVARGIVNIYEAIRSGDLDSRILDNVEPDVRSVRLTRIRNLACLHILDIVTLNIGIPIKEVTLVLILVNEQGLVDVRFEESIIACHNLRTVDTVDLRTPPYVLTIGLV